MKKRKPLTNEQRTVLTDLLSPKESLKKALKPEKKVESQVKEIHHASIIRTTVHLPESVHLKMKVHCIKQGVSIKEFISETLTKAL